MGPSIASRMVNASLLSDPSRNISILNDPQQSLCVSGPLTIAQLTGSGTRPHKERRASSLEEDYSYLSNLNKHALEEELSILVCYTRCASAALAIGGADR